MVHLKQVGIMLNKLKLKRSFFSKSEFYYNVLTLIPVGRF